jgi:phosphotransferase system HPr-like phosphotransfer protein
MNKKVTVNLNAIQKVKDFVNIIDKFESDVDIEQGKYVINAKSIMAIFSLNLLEPMVAKMDSENEEEMESFIRVMEEFKYESKSE